MSRWSPHTYKEQAKQFGIAEEVAKTAIRTAHMQQDRGLPAILTLNHLAHECSVPYSTLRENVERRSDMYTTFRSRKRSGGWRHICIPDPFLMRAQKWICDHVLSRLAPHPASMAFAPACSPLKCARMHCGCRWLIKVDVRKFFESITEIQAYRVFCESGYAPLVSFELGRICTRKSASNRNSRNRGFAVYPNRNYLSDYETRTLGYLPQGAPTSPMLANMAMQDFDNQVSLLAQEMHLCYTRYADDMFFSTSGDFTRVKAKSVVDTICKMLSLKGLRPHTAKTVIAPPGSRKIVLGLLVDGPGPRLTRHFCANLDTHLHCLETRGPIAHAKYRKFDSVAGMRNHIGGLVSHAISVNQKYGVVMKSRLDSIKWPV